MNKALLYIHNNLLHPMLCALTGSVAVYFLINDLSIPETLAVALGIVCGFVFAEKVFHRAGVDVFFIPTVFASLFAAGVTYVAGGEAFTGKYIVRIWLWTVLAVFIGQITTLLLLGAYERILRFGRTREKQGESRGD